MKLIRISLLIAVVLISGINLRAQDEAYPKTKFGLRGGVNANSWTNEFPSVEIAGQSIYPDAWKATYGFHVGANANIRLSQLIAIEPGILYTVKGTGTTIEENGISGEGNVKSNYIDIPFLLRLYVSGGFNIFLGPQMAYHLNSSYDLFVEGDKIVSGEDATEGMSEYDVAGILGVGYEFGSGVNINLSGEMGFLTVDSYDELSTFNRNIRLSIGFAF